MRPNQLSPTQLAQAILPRSEHTLTFVVLMQYIHRESEESLDGLVSPIAPILVANEFFYLDRWFRQIPDWERYDLGFMAVQPFRRAYYGVSPLVGPTERDLSQRVYMRRWLHFQGQYLPEGGQVHEYALKSVINEPIEGFSCCVDGSTPFCLPVHSLAEARPSLDMANPLIEHSENGERRITLRYDWSPVWCQVLADFSFYGVRWMPDLPDNAQRLIHQIVQTESEYAV